MTQIIFPRNFIKSARMSAQIEGTWNKDGGSETNWNRRFHAPGRIREGVVEAIDVYRRSQKGLPA